MNGGLKQIEAETIIEQANFVLKKLKINSDITDLCQLNSLFFVCIIEKMCFDKLKNTIHHISCRDDETFNYNIILSALSGDILGEDLNHIRPDKLVLFDLLSLKNLLEIFSELLKFIEAQVGSNYYQSTDAEFKQTVYECKPISPGINMRNITKISNTSQENHLANSTLSNTTEGIDDKQFIDLGELSSSNCRRQSTSEAIIQNYPNNSVWEKDSSIISAKSDSESHHLLASRYSSIEDISNSKRDHFDESGTEDYSIFNYCMGNNFCDNIPVRTLDKMKKEIKSKINLKNSLSNHREHLKNLRKKNLIDSLKRNNEKLKLFQNDIKSSLDVRKLKKNRLNDIRINSKILDRKLESIRALRALEESKRNKASREYTHKRRKIDKFCNIFESKIKNLNQEIITNHRHELDREESIYKQKMKNIDTKFRQTVDNIQSLKEEVKLSALYNDNEEFQSRKVIIILYMMYII
ncbi:MAG: Centrosomal protein of 95 kDa [Marteilia pararefringens]